VSDAFTELVERLRKAILHNQRLYILRDALEKEDIYVSLPEETIIEIDKDVIYVYLTNGHIIRIVKDNNGYKARIMLVACECGGR